MLLKDRVALVTGGARGIGRGIALKFAEEGCAVAIADIKETEAEQTLKGIAGKGSKGIFIKCDATDSSQVKQMVNKVISTFGKIDILVNNAGGFTVAVPLSEITEEAWDKNVDLNMKSAFLVTKAVAPYMIEKKYGKIINLSSVAAITSGPPSIHYASSKGGVLSMTFDLAGELGRYGICVNAILPGTIRTPLWTETNVPKGANEDEFFDGMAKKMILLQRAGYPEDIAGVALFFASSLSDYVTGDRLIVGGGFPLQMPPF
ncbi:MAG: family oxidoreductase [Chloroflexi bacterium]|jgi:NAD(P)-dependent dehydrogenase (short-subunit alcohol dehydrogenase family)|nr:family oxidoreductase [Chloroflexota bacterium]